MVNLYKILKLQSIEEMQNYHKNMFLNIKNNHILKFIFFLCLINTDIFARPYLKIQQVRAIDYPYIKIEVSVAKITPIKNLKEANFKLYENNWQISHFQIQEMPIEHDPKIVILLIDSSASLTQTEFDIQIKAANDFLKAMNPNDKAVILNFGLHVNKQCSNPVESREAIQCLANIKQNNDKTLLYDAIFEATKLSQKMSPNRRSIILFAKGIDSGSVIQTKDLLEHINTPIFVLGAGETKDLTNLAKLARVSGGEIYHINNAENLSKLYLLLNEIFDSSYLIQYISQASNTSIDGRKVQLRMTLDAESLQEEDTYTFLIPPFSAYQLFNHLQKDEKYILFCSGLIILSLFFIIVIILLRKQSPVKVEWTNIPTIQKENINDDYIESTRSKKNKKSKKNSEEEYMEEKLEQPQDNYLGPYAYLVEKEGPNAGKKYKMNWNVITIGYSDENAIVLQDPMISYKHAKIVRKINDFILYDLLSEQGVWLNGKKLLGPKKINDFDEIQLGRSKLIFRKLTN